MKKIITTVLGAICLCMTAIPAQAQLKWGIKGGLNQSRLSFEEGSYSSKNQLGFFIGPMAEFTFPATGLGIDASLLYSEQTLRLNEIYSEYDKNGKSQGLEIPINLKYTFGLGSTAGIFVNAGPNLFFDFSKDDDLYNLKLTKKDMSIGMNIGAGIKLIKKLQIGINYTIPLNDSGDLDYSYMVNDLGVHPYRYKTKNWKMSVAYLF